METNKKINIAEMLKDCPKGTTLYSPICGECRVFKIYDHLGFDVINETDDIFNFSYDGRYNLMGECCIFPSKKNRDWSTFKRPFKDGDVVSIITDKKLWYGIYKKEFIDTLYCYVSYSTVTKSLYLAPDNLCSTDSISEIHFSTDEEKQKLFDAIKSNGYKWNAETKTLEKLIESKFKVGDWVEFKYYERKPAKVIRIENNVYYLSSGDTLMFQDEHCWELTTKKFDIATLKPFTKVLVRDSDAQKWTVDLFSFFDKSLVYPYSCVGHYTSQCIPFEGNEHLLGTSNDCDEFYKNW